MCIHLTGSVIYRERYRINPCGVQVAAAVKGVGTTKQLNGTEKLVKAGKRPEGRVDVGASIEPQANR